MEDKKMVKCSDRISLALEIRNMKQADLCEKTKIPKSAISQYISGAFEPKQDRLFLIAQALNVDPVWLMGFDVPMEKEAKKISPETSRSEREETLLELFHMVPEEFKDNVIEMIRAASKIHK